MEQTFDIKPKICKMCPTHFKPRRSTDRYCSYECALKDAKVRETGLKAPKRKRIAIFSTTRRQGTDKYRQLRQDYIDFNSLCAIRSPECTTECTEIHHSKGRGKYFLDTGTWYKTCRACHDYIHHNSEGVKWAREKGFINNGL